MEFYSFDEIKEKSNCITIARELGLEIDCDGRCAALWRGGHNQTAVSINADGWHDFAEEESGSVIDLVALLNFNGDRQRAQNWLGRRLGLEPKMKLSPNPTKKKSRHDRLIEDGYTETCRYDYTDGIGNLVQQVIRMEHPEKKKEFLQCDDNGAWSVKHVEPVLYNLPAIIKSDWVIVVEGEKDADTLIAWGLPATTNPQGAKKWKSEHSEILRGKDVVIIPDNDTQGESHLHTVGNALVDGIAKSVRFIRLSKLPKGDVTDWVEQESGTLEQLRKMLPKAEVFVVGQPTLEYESSEAVRRAKEANTEPLKNYALEPWGKKTKRVPRHVNALIDDCHIRFLGFPRKVGEQLFDHDKDSGRIHYFCKPSTLFSWMQRKSGQHVEWARGDSFVTKEEYFEGLIAEATRYESISKVPDWPKRDDVYYSHLPLPPPSKNFSVFEKFINFFSPASEENKMLVKTFVAAPLFYQHGIPRPSWIIDSEDGAGTGKTTLAEVVAMLYGAAPIQVQKYELRQDMTDIVKRLVSSEGRIARMFLIDNVTGEFVSEELAGLITRTDITGKAPYGRGEETRPNNLTYVITANSATIDNDLAVRSFYIFVKRANISASWKGDVMNFVNTNRNQIFADIIGILNTHKPFSINGTPISPSTRFPEFETMLLQAFCGGVDRYSQVVKLLCDKRAESNIEEEQAAQIEETIRYALVDVGVQPDQEAVFIRSNVIEKWIQSAFSHRIPNPVQLIRNLSKSGLLPVIDSKIKRYPHNGKDRRSGVMWQPDPEYLADRTVVKRGKDIILQKV